MTVKVTQEDREVAAHIAKTRGRVFVANIEEGLEDDTEVVQIVARHRINAEARGYAAAKAQAAGVARDHWIRWGMSYRPSANAIATAIEAMEHTDDND